jgi:thiol:disulfide interchange protein
LFAGVLRARARNVGLFELQMPTASNALQLADKQKGGVPRRRSHGLSRPDRTSAPRRRSSERSRRPQTGNVGASALAMSMGMGAPLLPRRRLGRAAAAARRSLDEHRQAGFGVMMVGIAIWMMERVLPGLVTLVLWALLVFLTGVFLGAFELSRIMADAGSSRALGRLSASTARCCSLVRSPAAGPAFSSQFRAQP